MQLNNTNKAAEKWGALIVERAQLELGTRRRQTAGSGRTYIGRKVSSDALRKGLGYTHSISGKNILSFDFGAKVDYGTYVHEGRQRGKMPPLDSIIDWMGKKRIRPRDAETGSFVQATPGRVRSLAYLIARSIGKYGVEPFPFFSMAFDHHAQAMEKEIADAFVDDFLAEWDVQNGNNNNTQPE